MSLIHINSVFLLCLCTYLSYVVSLPEQSQWSFEITTEKDSINISRSVYSNTTFSIYLQCQSAMTDQVLATINFSEMPCISSPLGIDTEFIYIQEEMDEQNKYKMFQPKHIKCVKNIQDATHVKPPDSLVVEYNSKEGDTIIFLHLSLWEATNDSMLSGFIQFESKTGLLSPVDWPLLPFYGTMCFIYAAYSAVWIVLCFYYLNELLRIQHWIGAVIFLGMLEKAFFVAEYESINKTGVSVQGVLVTAELISCLKRALARMLFIVVSLGFGIVRPRLGAQLHRAVAVGLVFFVVSATDGVMRVVRHKTDKSSAIIIPPLMLSAIDSFICLWVFTSLMGTIRMLALKKNAMKLSLYRHFRNTLLFAIIMSITFSVWNTKYFTFTECITNWHEMWFQEAFWHILFSVLLLVVMILWRPSANSKRYAYCPSVDSDENVVFEQPSNDAYDVKKTRNAMNNNGIQHSKENSNDDDLKWVEDNIPTSVLDINLMDSDEEKKERLLHTSKMQ